MFHVPSASGHGDLAFISTGFRDWKHACGRKGVLACHESSRAHKACALTAEQFRLNMERQCTISQRLSTEYKELVQNNRHYVKCLATVALICAQQGIALRGHGDDMHDPSVNPGNFKVIVNLLSHYDEIVKEHVVEGPRNATYLGHVIQNELLKVMASEVKKKIETELHEATYYTLIVDETKDVSKKEQLAVIE